MAIHFSEVFKSLRKRKDLTQEQMADILSVSPQAISRWETASTYPDITILPAIANFFETTIDELLGTNEDKVTNRINSYMNRFQEAIGRGAINESIELMRAAISEFPNSYSLLAQLMYVLYVSCEDETLCNRYNEEIISIGERILNYCHDDAIRMEAKKLLFRHYCGTNRKIKAIEIASTLPDECKEEILYWALDGEDRLNHLKELIIHNTRDLTWAIWAYATHTGSTEDKIKFLLSLQNIEKIIYSQGDYGHVFISRARISATLAELYLQSNDIKNCIINIENAVNAAISYVLLPKQIKHTSPLISDVLYDKTKNHTSDTRNLCEQIYENYFKKSMFDLIRNNSSIEKLKSYFNN